MHRRPVDPSDPGSDVACSIERGPTGHVNGDLPGRHDGAEDGRVAHADSTTSCRA